MFDFIKNFFWYKAKSIEKFVKAIKREDCKTATIEPCLIAKGGIDTTSVDVIANIQYTLEFAATTSRGQNIVYREQLSERFESDISFAGAKERRDNIIKLFLLGEQKVKELRTKLPVGFIDPNGRPMGNTMCATPR